MKQKKTWHTLMWCSNGLLCTYNSITEAHWKEEKDQIQPVEEGFAHKLTSFASKKLHSTITNYSTDSLPRKAHNNKQYIFFLKQQQKSHS